VINTNKISPPKTLIVIMGYSPEDNGAQATRAISLFDEIKKIFPDTYLMMKEGSKPNIGEGYNLIQPWIPLKGKLLSLKEIFFRVQMTISIIKFIYRNKVTNVILRGYDTVALFPFLKFKGVKIFYDFHGKYDLELIQQGRYTRAIFVKMCDKVILQLADRILVVSEGIQAQIPKYRHKCLHLQNGVDIQKIEDAKYMKPIIGIPERKYVVGFIGNWEQVMRIDDICEAVKSVDNTCALIIGQGYKADDIFTKYQNGNIMFTGRINHKDALCLLHRMDVCVIPYDKDHYMSEIKDFFSNRKIYEYMAAGKPIIVANIEGKPRYLVNNVNCLTYRPGDIMDLARKIVQLKNDPSLAKKMSEVNLKLAKNYTWESIIKNSRILDELK
jgi:glycosyltransferase involved in cell wall biosynthesis